MKAVRSVRSVTSFKSTKSMRTNPESRLTDTSEFIDLVTVLPTVCARFQCPYNIVVKKEYQQDSFYKSLKYGDTTPRSRKKLSILPTQLPVASPLSEVKAVEEDKSEETEASVDGNTLTITAVYDTYNCVSEILLSQIKVPRILMQVIALLAPYFQNLTTITVRQCSIDYLIVHEISKILELSTITTITLDNSPVLQRTYEGLLNEKSSLRCLSLCKCKLDDNDCKLIAAKLHHGEPAENLQVLNMASNHITDVGAKHISDALRTNRRLRCLNLADNWINDEGAGYLFNVLTEFPLTYDEIQNMRIRYMKYLKYKRALYAKYLHEVDRSFDELSLASRKSVKRRKSGKKDRESVKYSDEDAKERAELLANEILGQFTDPFDSNSIKHRDNYYYCVGNMMLSYLNLAYNNLSYLSLKKLLNVLRYQNVTKKSNPSGLIKVLIEGNNLPSCKELFLINELLYRNIKNIPSKVDVKRRRSRAF